MDLLEWVLGGMDSMKRDVVSIMEESIMAMIRHCMPASGSELGGRNACLALTFSPSVVVRVCSSLGFGWIEVRPLRRTYKAPLTAERRQNACESSPVP